MPRGGAHRRSLKAKWFERGHQAFEYVFPGLLGRDIPNNIQVYVCPICVRAYPREAIDAKILTFEDAPPKWYAGRARGIALTCQPCNNTLGSKLDSHAARASKGGPIRSKATIDGTAINVFLEATPQAFRIYGRPDANREETATKFFDIIKNRSDAGKPDWKLNLKWREPYSLRKAHLSWLKAAYIVGFARFGYRWAFSPGIKIVRDQLLSIDDELITVFKLTNPAMQKNVRRIVEIAEPSEIASLGVQMGEHLVFLPRPNDLDFYERLKKDMPRKKSSQFIGQELEWPTEPTHHYDFSVPTEKVTI